MAVLLYERPLILTVLSSPNNYSVSEVGWKILIKMS